MRTVKLTLLKSDDLENYEDSKSRQFLEFFVDSLFRTTRNIFKLSYSHFDINLSQRFFSQYLISVLVTLVTAPLINLNIR